MRHSASPLFLTIIASFCLVISFASAQDRATAKAASLDTSRGDKMLADYFAAETAKLRDNCLAEIKTLDDWNAKKGEYRRQLLEMLGLDPSPEKTDLKPVVTGKLEHDEFVVEKLHFQSRPGLYVTGNLYLPKKIEKPLPAILYVCGHSRVIKDGVPMGAKAGYQHHGAWYARNGYACLTIDTLQLGEIEGIHHGTHRYGMWWWASRGYCPAGVEAWNCVRALDYLETRPEVDQTRFGVTGRSGGGAYSWWIAAIDDRIKVAVPTAGITDLQNHVVDGCVEGHCDCMYMLNTYRWDYPLVAALVAPRPLLIANTDSDRIFPLDGVYRTFEKVRRIYRLHEPVERGITAKVALNITAGPHKDTQELNTHEFRWFNHFLKNDDSPIDSRALKYFEPEQLKVFNKLPEDQINTKIHETFVAKAPPPEVPRDKPAWDIMSRELNYKLFDTTFPWWHLAKDDLDVTEAFSVDRDGIRFAAYDFKYRRSQFPLNQPLRLYALQRADIAKPELHVLTILDDSGWQEFLAKIRPAFENQMAGERFPDANDNAWQSLKANLLTSKQKMSFFAPPGVGPTAFDPSERKQIQNRRRFYLLGETLDSLQLWAIGLAIAGVRDFNRPLVLAGDRSLPELHVRSQGFMAGIVLCLGGKGVDSFELYDPPKTFRNGPYFLNVERYLDMPQAVALAARHAKIVIYQDDDSGWEYPQAVAKSLGWDANQIQIRKKPPQN